MGCLDYGVCSHQAWIRIGRALQELKPTIFGRRSGSSITKVLWALLLAKRATRGGRMVSPRKRDSDSCLSTPVEDESSEDKDGVGNILPVKMFEPVHSVSPSGNFRRRINSWRKGEPLGRGLFGAVYEGLADDGFFFAVKEVSLLDQEGQGKQSVLQLEQEISLLSQFEHENIVRYLGTDKDDKNLYIFFELMTKGSLVTLYRKYNLEDSQVSLYTRQILNGLKYLHDQDVVHRDIKCANILVDASGAVKLTDFGLGKATKMNDAKSVEGTAFWMAPEVVKNESYGSAADIWSLGCTVLEMLTRQPPYSHLEGMQALFRIGRGEPPPVPDSLSREAQDLILRCLQVNPNDRPSAGQLLDHPFVRKPSTSSVLEPVHRGRITLWQKGELLGSGSFGTVYKGFTDDGFFFAIKEVSLLDQGSQGKQSLLQLEQEMSLLSQLEHKNIVRYLGTDKDDKNLYIFLELMTEGSLATLYHKYNFRDSQVSAYTRQILYGLKYLHDQNVVHRDIKCANVLVDVSGAVKLADFGLAKATKMNDAKSSKGTPFWMAPEVVNPKKRSYGLAVDIWSLGCTVLEMLTRQRPYSHLEGVCY